MSYADDQMIDEDETLVFADARTREEWDQLFASLRAAENLPTLAKMPDFSDHPERVVDGQGVEFKTHPGGGVIGNTFYPTQVVADRIARLERPFAPARDLPAAMRESEAAFNFEWGTIPVGDPVVVAAIREASRAERLKYKHGVAYRCDSCLTAGGLETFPWAGALFIHLLTCPHFKRGTHDAEGL